MDKGLVGFLLASLCTNYPPDNSRPSTTTPYPTYRQYTPSPTKDFTCVLKNNEQLIKDLLRGRTIRIATLRNDYPLSGVTWNNTEPHLQEGTVAEEIIQVLQEEFGFKYKVVLPEKNILGNKGEGIFGLLYKHEADMAAAFLPVVPGSHDMVLWGVNMVMNDYYVLMLRPRASAKGSGIFAPFTTQVWYLILVSLLVVGPIVYFLMYLRVRICSNDDIKVYPLTACVWFVYGALVKQGSTLSPVPDSTRLLFATWWLFIMILTAFYTANLTAFLTLSRFTLPISNVEDISRSSRQWFAEEGGPVEYAIMNYDDGDLKPLRLSVDKKRGHFIDDIDADKIKQCVKKDWLYLEESRKLQKFLLDDYVDKTKRNIPENTRCTYVLTQNSYLTRSLAFAYPKTSILSTLFDPVLLSMVESGIMEHRVQEDLPGATICPLNLDSKERQLRNSDLWTTYVIVMSGFSTAITVFVAELLWRRCIAPAHPHRSWPLDVALVHPNHSINRFTDGKSKQHSKVHINGREYYIVITKNGEKRFIPIRTPSALLFQYAPK